MCVCVCVSVPDLAVFDLSDLKNTKIELHCLCGRGSDYLGAETC